MTPQVQREITKWVVQAALGVVRVCIADLRLGGHDNLAVLGGFNGGAQPGRPAAYDQHIGKDVGQPAGFEAQQVPPLEIDVVHMIIKSKGPAPLCRGPLRRRAAGVVLATGPLRSRRRPATLTPPRSGSFTLQKGIDNAQGITGVSQAASHYAFAQRVRIRRPEDLVQVRP